jgi:hypothetical protein
MLIYKNRDTKRSYLFLLSSLRYQKAARILGGVENNHV